MTRDLSVRIEEATNWHPVGTANELKAVRKICE
jgi:hypothetical protein